MAQYVFSYGEVSLPLTKTSFNIEQVQSEDGIDRLYNHVTIDIQSLVNRSTNPLAGGNAAYLKFLRTSFSEPRQHLTYLFNDEDGTNFFINTGPSGDAQNGPIVSNVKITEIQGGSILVNLTVECWIAECDWLGRQPDTVLSCRWEQTIDIDINELSTITTDGILVVRADANVTADQLRENIVPVRTIPKGFVREHKQFTMSSDGTKLMFQIVDREVPRVPTDGITDFEATWDEESNLENGNAIVIGTFNARCAAPKTVRTDKLAQFLAGLAFSRISFQPDNEGKKDLLLSYKFTEYFHLNQLELTMSVLIVSQSNSIASPSSTRIGSVISTDLNDNKTQWRSRGTAAAQIFGAKITNSCGGKGEATATNQIAGVPAIAYNNDFQIVPDIIEHKKNKVSDAQKDHPYTRWEINDKVKSVYNTIQLPYGKTVNGYTSTAAVLAPVTSKRTVRFELERLGALPDIPNPEIDDNHFVLSSEITTTDARFLPDGETVAYYVAGEYELGMRRPYVIGVSDLALPQSPIQNADASAKKIASSNFTYKILS